MRSPLSHFVRACSSLRWEPPSGARAASAGVMITMAAHVAAMAPGTHIGAAHPVQAGGKDIGETMAEKVTNDMVAFVKGIATKRGRNVEWAEKAVRESVSVTETEALEQKIIDLVAIGFVLWVLSGIYMWWQLKQTRIWGYVALGGGCLTFLIFLGML